MERNEMKRKVYKDGNGSSLIMVEGFGEYIPKSEFVKLKAELEQHDDQITNIEIANQEMLAVADARINKLVDENNGLKAQISLIKRHADSLMDSNSGIDYSGKMDGLLDAIDENKGE
jgi:uncharacterized protein YdcH (DUF465 family)